MDTHLWWQTDHARIGQTLWDHGESHSESGYQIADTVSGVVVRQPGEEGQSPQEGLLPEDIPGISGAAGLGILRLLGGLQLLQALALRGAMIGDQNEVRGGAVELRLQTLTDLRLLAEGHLVLQRGHSGRDLCVN